MQWDIFYSSNKLQSDKVSQEAERDIRRRTSTHTLFTSSKILSTSAVFFLVASSSCGTFQP